MKHLNFSLLMLVALPASAQDWDMFPLDQRSYFQYSAQGHTLVDMVLVDSTYLNAEGEQYLFNKRQFRRSFLGDCAAYGLAHLTAYSNYFNAVLNQGVIMDSLLVRNDTVFFSTDLSSTPFFFLPKAIVGESWTVSSSYSGNQASDVLVTCTGLGEETFLGITDSVKTFSLQAMGSQEPLNSLQVRLSKEHGLIEYVPFFYFLYHPPQSPIPSFSLIGLANSMITAGYQQPGFPDYFHLAPGDLLVWEHYVDPGWIQQGQPYYEYSRDSLTGALHTPDSVVYTYDRTDINATGVATFHPQQFRAYRLSEYSDLINAAPNDLAMGDTSALGTPMVFAAFPIELKIDSVTGDTISIFGFGSHEGFLAEEGCFILEPSDLGRGSVLNTRVGLEETSNWTNPSFDRSRVIGSRVGGMEEGDLTVGLDDLGRREQGLTIYPNPATDDIFLRGTDIVGAAYTIMDGLGRVMQQGVVEAGGIALWALPGGLYVLKLRQPDRLRTMRFVKQ